MKMKNWNIPIKILEKLDFLRVKGVIKVKESEYDYYLYVYPPIPAQVRMEYHIETATMLLCVNNTKFKLRFDDYMDLEFATDGIDKLNNIKEIENNAIVDLILPESEIYDFEYWQNVIILNKSIFEKIKSRLNCFKPKHGNMIYFEYYDEDNEFCSTDNFSLQSLDLINKQFRFLQELHYSKHKENKQ